MLLYVFHFVILIFNVCDPSNLKGQNAVMYSAQQLNKHCCSHLYMHVI